MENLPKDTSEIIIEVGSRAGDPRICASKAHGKEIVDFQFGRMITLISEELEKLE